MLAHLAHPTCYSKLHFEFELADYDKGRENLNRGLFHLMTLLDAQQLFKSYGQGQQRRVTGPPEKMT